MNTPLINTRKLHTSSQLNLNVCDERQLQAHIDLVEGRAVRRCITAARVQELARWAEAELDRRGIQPSRRKGAKAWISPLEVGANYGYPALSTTVRIVRKADGWYFFAAARVRVSGHRGGGLFHLGLTPSQRKTAARTAAQKRRQLVRLAREVAGLDDEGRKNFIKLTAKLNG